MSMLVDPKSLPAFPHDDHSGMTKREYVATMIAQGLVGTLGADGKPNVAVTAVRLADELLNELAKAG